MSSAIEVLKEMQQFWFEGIELNKRNGDETSFKEFQELNALGEAIVALEKQERLKEWLEKEIKYWEKRRIEYKDKEQYEDYMEDLALQRILSYERVLERVGEQK